MQSAGNHVTQTKQESWAIAGYFWSLAMLPYYRAVSACRLKCMSCCVAVNSIPTKLTKCGTVVEVNSTHSATGL